METNILGIHHITAISGPAQENYRFYTQTLGLRLVKKTVNFDDPSVYHLYYGDETGSPGTLMTFFPYGGSGKGNGTGQVAATCYPVKSLREWKEKLSIDYRTETRFDQEVLIFEDPHGMVLEFYQSESAPARLGPIGGATLRVQSPKPTEELLRFLGLKREAHSENRSRFRIPGSENFLEVEQSDAPPSRGGAGSVHHIALRVAEDGAQDFWRKKLVQAGYRVSPVMDRNYFHSIYFRDPAGILFEIATDPPGMLIDESVEELGQKLLLPPQHEPHRLRIESALEPLEGRTLRSQVGEFPSG